MKIPMKEAESKSGGEPNYAARFAWATAAILLTMALMTVAADNFV